MLKMFSLERDFLKNGTKDEILASFGDWHTFIQYVDGENKINLQTLKEGIDDRVRALAQIDQRLADLYLRSKFVNHHSYRSY